MKHKIIDPTYHFITLFDDKTGAYLRSGIIENGIDTGKDSFMASFPHLIDVGVMGHCSHGKTGLCRKAGIGCYQSGALVEKPNMTIDDFQWIATQCQGRTNQFALGGRGDPDQHEHFEELLQICRESSLVPNFTTSGYGLTPYLADICGKYCGAVAVSWYRSTYTQSAIQMLMDAKVKTNIHYVLGQNSIDEAIERLEKNDFPTGINAVIFLLHKPAGQGTYENVLTSKDSRVKRFFEQVDKNHPFKVGMDSCNVPGAINFCKNILPESLDSCEGGRFSCYIGADMVMLPCSFDQKEQYGVKLNPCTIEEAWNSKPFACFRSHMHGACPDCEKRELCLGGCPLMPEIVFCSSEHRKV